MEEENKNPSTGINRRTLLQMGGLTAAGTAGIGSSFPARADDRSGGVEANAHIDVEPYDDIWPRLGEALISSSDEAWNDIIGNALLCGVNEKLASQLGAEEGDMISVRSRAFDQERVFQVHTVYTDHEPDRMRAVVRTGRWGRYRFTNATGATVVENYTPVAKDGQTDSITAIDEEDVTDMEIEVELVEPDDGVTYIGVNQSLGEWVDNITTGNERIFFQEELADTLDIRTKHDGPPTDENSHNYGPEAANVDEGWDNLRLQHADYPERYQAYTAYGTFSEPDGAPKIRMTLPARRRLNNPDYDPAVDEVPNSFVVRLETDTAYHVPDPDLTQPSMDEENMPHSDIYHPTVYEEEESAEWYRDDPNKRFLSFAPHGGNIELRTSRICRFIAEELDSAYWIHEGYRDDPGSSFDRWHTTSVDMRDGYPAIDALGYDWDYAISIHGFTEDDPLIGGLFDQESRETYGYEYLQPALPDETVQVIGDDHPDWAEQFAGTNPRNVTNEFTNNGNQGGKGGIQLELPSSARIDEKWIDVAEATIEFYQEEIGIE